MSETAVAPDAVETVVAALAAPFGRHELKFRPGAIAGNRALALAYVDARVIQDRLDAVLGPVNWQTEFEFLPDGSALCRLRLRLGGEWITKTDVGGPSEQPDEGDRRKAAVSDALKRAAVNFGVGRYLYRLPAQWVDYDPRTKQLKNLPAVPGPTAPKTVAAPKDAPVAPAPKAETAACAARLVELDAEAVLAGGCPEGSLTDFVVGSMVRRYKVKRNVAAWPKEVCAAAVKLAAEARQDLGRDRVLTAAEQTFFDQVARQKGLSPAELLTAAGGDPHRTPSFRPFVRGLAHARTLPAPARAG